MQRRYKEHQVGTKKCKYTRSFPPKQIAACWKIFSCLSDILKIECFIKSLPKSKKNSLIQKPESLIELLESREMLADGSVPLISIFRG